MAVFPLENGVFSGTLLRFNVRGYVYIWSLIFSMFKFFVHVHWCVAIYACSSCASVYSLYIYLGNGEMGFRGMGNELLNGLIRGNGSMGRSVSNLVIK